MKRVGHGSRSSGFVLTEAVVSIALLAVLMTMVSLLMVGYQRAADAMLNTRRAQWAAETQLERIRAGLDPVANRSFDSMDGVSFNVGVSDGEGDWRGLRRVAVTASVTGKHGHIVKHTIRAYLPPPAANSGAQP
jgi:type II secretory pathway pseudopilin PulG